MYVYKSYRGIFTVNKALSLARNYQAAQANCFNATFISSIKVIGYLKMLLTKQNQPGKVSVFYASCKLSFHDRRK